MIEQSAPKLTECSCLHHCIRIQELKIYQKLLLPAAPVKVISPETSVISKRFAPPHYLSER